MQIPLESALRQMAHRCAIVPEANWWAYHTALPERDASPLIIEEAEVLDLIAAVRRHDQAG